MGMSGVWLSMDAAAGGGTLAVLRDGMVIAERAVVMRSENEERFFPAVLDVLGDVQCSLKDIERIIVGAGPGSFTALRVVGATAKGIAHARGVPMYAVPSLALSVTAEAPKPNTRWLSTLDALRGERYAALVEIGADGNVARVQQLGLIAIEALAAAATEHSATRIGPDEAHTATPHARGVARCLALVESAGAVPLASWEPMYGRLAEAQVKWEAAQGRTLK